MTFSKKLSELRKRVGLSQEQLAEMLDVSRQSVSKWEGQQTLPETAKVIVIADIFNISLDVLLRDEYELDEVPSANSTPQADATGMVTPEEPSGRIRSSTQGGGKVRSSKYLAGVLGAVALLLVAVLLIGMIGADPGQSSVPSASTSSSEQTERGVSREQVKNHMKFKHYVRGVMRYIKVQNGKSKEDTDHAQAP